MKPATPKMIMFAEEIAETLDIDLPDLDSFEETSMFIEDNKDEFYAVMNGEDWR